MSPTSPANSRELLVWRVEPLPDFVADHTLAGETAAERLRDVVSRWVQWVGNLWGWHDLAAFALRFAARDGRTRVYLHARTHDQAHQELLRNELAVLLRSHRLGDGTTLDSAGQREFAADCLLAADPAAGLALVEVRQYLTDRLWKLPPSVRKSKAFADQFAAWPPGWADAPPVVYPWWGPGGPFLMPMESLISQPVPVTLTIYLQPTDLDPAEQLWLGAMAQHAQTQGEQTVEQLAAGGGSRVVDPSANLAGRLYMANLRRLTAAPFLVAAHCAAPAGSEDVARSVAGAVQALVHELPLDRPEQEDERLPSGAAVRDFAGDAEGRQRALRQYRKLRFDFNPADRLARLPYLADARGAATLFRLPVSLGGGVPGVPVRQLPPAYHPGARVADRPGDHLELGLFEDGGLATMPVDDLTKHALVTGFTGSGKTVTVLQLLHQLWDPHRRPFLVLESAKQEYRGLFGVPAFRNDLRVYTLGNERGVPFRLNPFELLPGVRVEAHLSRLQVCFEGAIPPIGPSSSVIAEALLRVYETVGWSLTDIYPEIHRPQRRFPTLSEFVAAVEGVIEARGYEGEVKSNLRAALVGRFKPLLLGSKGRMFDCQRSAPTPDDLFGRPTVLEMNDLNVDDKALVVMFVLTLLREHREREFRRRPADAPKLAHVTMVEEAHNVLENVSSKGGGEGATSADTRFKAVEAFCQLLTEIRALGEGLLIADQSPEKLARDAMRNTNLQIAHQLRDGHDREAVANAMIMEPEQQDYLGKLPPGHAGLFRTGLEKATFIRVRPYYPGRADLAAEPADPAAAAKYRAGFRGWGFDSNLTDADLAARMEALEAGVADRRRLSLPYRSCDPCQSKCAYRDAMFAAFETSVAKAEGDQFRAMYRDPVGVSKAELWRFAAGTAVAGAARAGHPAPPVDAGWCYFVHLWHDQFGRDAAPDQCLDTGDYRTFLGHWAEATRSEPPQREKKRVRTS